MLKEAAILTILVLSFGGCKTYEVDSVYKKVDRSLMLRDGGYSTFTIEPRVEVEIFKVPSIGKLSKQAKAEKNTRLSKAYQESYEATLESMFESVGLEKVEQKGDLELEYLILFKSSMVDSLKSETFGVYNLKGIESATGDLVFEMTGKVESTYTMNKDMARRICMEIFSQLEIFNSVQPVAGGDATR